MRLSEANNEKTMKLSEFASKLTEYIEAYPESADMDLYSEGCDCYGTVVDLCIVDASSRNGLEPYVLIKRDN